MGDTETVTVEKFVRLFREDDGLRPDVTLCAEALLGPTPEFVEAALIAMNDADGVVRARGARFLGIAKFEGKGESIPATLWARGESGLRAQLQDSEEFVRSEAALALGRLSPTVENAQAAFPILFSIAKTPERDDFLMRDVGRAAKLFAPVVPEEAIRLAPRLLQDSDEEVVCYGIATIGQCGALAISFLPQLAKLAKDRNESFRFVARNALRKLGRKPPFSLWAAISWLRRGFKPDW